MFAFYSFCEDSFAGLGASRAIVVINFETGQIMSWVVGPLISSSPQPLGEMVSLMSELGELISAPKPLGEINSFPTGEGGIDSSPAF